MFIEDEIEKRHNLNENCCVIDKVIPDFKRLIEEIRILRKKDSTHEEIGVNTDDRSEVSTVGA